MSKPDYGGASHEEIIEGMKTAISLAETIKAVPNPAVRQMIKELLGMIRVGPPK